MKKIDFVSREQMKKMIDQGIIDDADVAIISINDSGPEYDDMCSLLRGSNSHAMMFADSDDGTGMGSLQAQICLSFIEKNHNKNFLIHCFMGISRSGAVAKFINDFYECGIFYLEDYSGYNRRVYNKLMAAAGMSLASYYEELEKQEREFPYES